MKRYGTEAPYATQITDRIKPPEEKHPNLLRHEIALGRASVVLMQWT